MRRIPITATTVLVAALLGACDESAVPTADPTGGGAALEPAAQLSPDLCALDRPGYTLDGVNRYAPLLKPDSQWRYEGEEEDGETIELLITVLRRSVRVGPVRTRVIEEREWLDGELAEVSRNFFAEAADGTLCYFGEEVDIFEDGQIVSHEGAWRADGPGNRPGIFMPANPKPGMKFAMENAPGVAEDQGRIVRTRTVTVPAGTFTQTIGIQESNPLEGGGPGDLKVFAAGVGMIVDGPAELVSFEIAR